MARPFLTRLLHLQNRELGWLAVPQVLHQCSSHRTYIFPCQTCLAFMVFQLLSAALAGLQPNPSAEAAWGFLWLTAQQADPVARRSLSCATTSPRGTGSGRLGFTEALLALEIMTKNVVCVFKSYLPGTPWEILKFFVAVLSSDWSTMIFLPCSYHGDQRCYWFDSLGWFLVLAFMEK